MSNNGSVIWDYSDNIDYHNSIAGIGLDECGRLRQWQNKSSLNNDFVAIGIGEISETVGANPNSLSNDNSYFLWGRNVEAFDSNGETDFGMTTNGEQIEARVARIWKAQETGTVGSLRIQFDISGGAGTAVYDLADTRLLVDTDDTFATGALSISPTSFNNATGIVNFDHDFSGVGFIYYFTLGSIDINTTPLPISLTSFNASIVENEVLCNWETKSEINNAYFTIEKSLDNENWLHVEDINGSGSSSLSKLYSCIDSNPFYGLSYYRLSQTDFNGTMTYGGVESVFLENISKPTMNIYPNPAKNLITVLFSKALSGSIEIYSSTGQVVLNKQIGNKVQTEIDITRLSSGIYYVNVKYDNLYEVVKLIVD